MLDKHYAPQAFEAQVTQSWLKSGAYSAQPKTDAPPYTILMPPANVTGSLHVGHALTFTLQDILIRYHRMQNFDCLWQPGIDHAGIATQMVVERELAKEGQTRQELGRSAFIDKVWEWKAHSGGTIFDQLEKIGASADWERSQFTMDPHFDAAVRKVFVDLYKEGLIYRDKRLVNWDTKLQTAVSDLEVQQVEEQGTLWYIEYPLVENPEVNIPIATTRPETFFADTAVAVHPEDSRYQHLIGQHVQLPLTNRKIPIIADLHSDPEKGSGAVKITPAHDFNDFEVGKRHTLPFINILTPEGFLNENVPKEYQGLDVHTARKQVVKDLYNHGFIQKEEKITHAVPYGDRSQVIIEPYLTNQWFIDSKKLAQPAIEAVKKEKIRFVPNNWVNTFFEWMHNIQPWCISRQIWWGHHIPAWYGPDQHIFVAETEEDASKQAHAHYGSPVELRRDTDVLDTWFSSALWPFVTLGWPQNSIELQKYYPTSVLVTGFDIIFFWVARMIMLSLHFIKDVPFRTVYIHALIRDAQGQKMSKSKGNVVDPLDSIERFGSDALRYTLAALSTPGRDIRLSEDRIALSRNFITKIWNACRYLEMNGCTLATGKEFSPEHATLPFNRWLLVELNETLLKVQESIQDYRFDELCRHLHRFIWNCFCDWYIEICKPFLMDASQTEAHQEIKSCAGWVMHHILKMLHPIMPFVTEHLWSSLQGSGMLIQQPFPKSFSVEKFSADYEEIDWVLNFIMAIRSAKADLQIAPSALLPLMPVEVQAASRETAYRLWPIIQKLGRIENLCPYEETTHLNKSIEIMVRGETWALLIDQAVDFEVEKQRLQRELEKLDATYKKVQKRLDQPDFIAKAPKELVDKAREEAAEIKHVHQKKQKVLERIVQLSRSS